MTEYDTFSFVQNPTQKQKQFVQEIADALNLKLPPNSKESYSAFINQHIENYHLFIQYMNSQNSEAEDYCWEYQCYDEPF